MASQPVVLEIDKVRTSTNKEVIFDNIIPAADSQAGEVLTWSGGATGTFVQSADFALTSYVDAEIAGVINGASIGYATLSDIEAKITDNATDIVGLQADVAANTLNIAANAADIAQEAADRGAVDVAFLGGATINYNSFGKIENHLIALDAQKLDVTANAVSATKWENPTTIHLQGMAAGTITMQGHESDIYVSMYVDSSMHNHNSIYYTKSEVDTDLANLKSDILGGASGAYDTLLEIESHITNNASDIGTLLTTMSTKAPMPPTTTAGEVLTFDGSSFQKDTSFAQTTYVDNEISSVVGSASSAYDELGKIEGVLISANSNISTLQTDLTTAEADILTLQTDLNTAEADILTKAPLPSTPTSLGDALSWNGSQFVNVTVSTGPPPLTPPTAPTGTNEAVQWDGSAFQNVSGYALTSDLLPTPTTSSTGEFLSWNGTAWVNSVPAGGGSGVTPTTPTASNEVLTWDGSAFQNSNAFALKPGATSLAGQFLQWNGSQFVNTAVPSGGGGSASVSGHIVQVVDNPQVGGEALTASGYSSKCFATITMNSNYSRILVMTAGAPTINGSAKILIHWRSKPSGGSWGTYADTGIIETTLYDKMSWLDLKDSSMGIHYPAATAGTEIEYRVYFNISMGTVYYPDPVETTSITNMILQEIAA